MKLSNNYPQWNCAPAQLLADLFVVVSFRIILNVEVALFMSLRVEWDR